MAMTVHVDIVSAEAEIYSGLAEMVIASGESGELGITPGHAPLLTALKAGGNVRLFLPNKEEEIFYVEGGMLEVQPNCVTVLADNAARADALDEGAAQAAKREAELALSKRGEKFNYQKAQAELTRAVAQIQAIKKLRKKSSKMK